MTNATFGLRGYLSSPSAALQQSLENRLKRQLDGAGSMLFSLTWNRKATPAGRPYCQLVASGRPISGSDFGSWPTPDATVKEAKGEFKQRPSKVATNRKTGYFGEMVYLASWPTPMAGTPAQRGYNEAGNTDSGRKTVALATWPTPRAEDSESSGIRHSRGVADTMTAVASLASWATPSARDDKDTGDLETSRFRKDGQERNDTMPRQAFGATPNGSHAQTEGPGQLDPDHSRWVMGYETEHLSCAPTETRLSLKSRQNLSVPR